MRALLPVSEPASCESPWLEDWYAPPAGLHVRANFVTSVDGAIEIEGRSAGLGGAADHRVFHLLRGLSDVVLVGAGTVRTEGYGPVRLSEQTQARRVTRRQAPLPPIAVVSGTAALDPAGRLFGLAAGGPRPIVLTTAAAPATGRQALAEVAEVVICGEHAVDLEVAIKALADRGLRQVLCEGGPTVLGQLATSGLLDELCLTWSPVLAGPGHGALSLGHHFSAPVDLRLTHLLEADGMLLSRYAVNPSPQSTATKLEGLSG